MPQFYHKTLQLLLPLHFGAGKSLVIPVEKVEKDLPPSQRKDPLNPAHFKYVGHTILTLDMAYNNARLLSAIESEWLLPNRQC